MGRGKEQAAAMVPKKYQFAEAVITFFQATLLVQKMCTAHWIITSCINCALIFPFVCGASGDDLPRANLGKSNLIQFISCFIILHKCHVQFTTKIGRSEPFLLCKVGKAQFYYFFSLFVTFILFRDNFVQFRT